MLQGKIISYSEEKKYGFINGNNKEKYFFHFSNLKNKKESNKLIQGTIVEFDERPTKKGLSAIGVSFPKVYYKKTLEDFFTTRNENPKRGVVEVRRPFSTKYYRDLNEAKNEIIRLAKFSEANAILNLRSEKATGSSGNYRYSIFRFHGDMAVVSNKKKCTTQEEERFSQLEIEEEINSFLKGYDKMCEIEKQKAIDAKNHTGKIVGIFLLFVFALFLFGGR